MKYTVTDRETGTAIEDAATLEEAESLIEKYENQDRENGYFEPNFYAIKNNETGEFEI